VVLAAFGAWVVQDSPIAAGPSARTATAGSRVPAGTADGTCLAYAPLQGNRHQTIFVDPGHGGVDSGTSGSTSAGSTVYEKDLTLATGLDLLPLLRDDGYRVVMSRVDDRLLVPLNPNTLSDGVLTDLGEHDDGLARIACANAAQASVLVAIHFDAFSDPSVGGAETIYDSARTFSTQNLHLGTLVQQALLSQFAADGWAVPDRGVVDDIAAGTPALTPAGAAYGHLVELGPAAPGYVDHPSRMPGVLIEPLFLSDPTEADIAASVKGQLAIAHALAGAVKAFLSPPAAKPHAR
jgi:N-acetylmuramoyl-L-alanine amidase